MSTLTGHPIAAFISLTIAHAVVDNATAIHIRPEHDGLRIRFLQHGRFINAHHIEGTDARDEVTRITKTLAGLDPDHTGTQTGRLITTIDGTVHDLPVQTLPARHGDKIIILTNTDGTTP